MMFIRLVKNISETEICKLEWSQTGYKRRDQKRTMLLYQPSHPLVTVKEDTLSRLNAPRELNTNYRTARRHI